MIKSDLDMLSHWLQSPVHTQNVREICRGQLYSLQYIVFGDPRGKQAWDRLNLQECLQKVYARLSGSTAQTLKVYMIPSVYPETRHFPNSPILTRKHFNSGMCVHDATQRTVYVYRNHAIRKVFVHELLHAFDMHPMRPSPELDLKTQLLITRLGEYHPWLKTFQSRTLFHEAVVEAFACKIAENYRCKDETNDFLRWGDRFHPRSNSHAFEYVLLKKYVTPLIRHEVPRHFSDAELCRLADAVLNQIQRHPKNSHERILHDKFGK